MIKITDVTKSYGSKQNSFWALKGVSLSIEKGDYAVILGPSGSGKSTLMNIVSGLEKPDGGSVLYDGSNICGLDEGQLTKFRKKHVGFIFQQYYLLPNLNIEQNVKMGADLAGNKEYKTIIEAVGLREKMDKYPSQLSGGEQQRASIARALAKTPQVLFLDEPTGALDEETGRTILDYIGRLQEERGFTIVMVTHNENIADMANTVIRMNSGRIMNVSKNSIRKNAYEIGW